MSGEPYSEPPPLNEPNDPEQIPYAATTYYSPRPAILTVIAVMGIIVSSCGLLMGLWQLAASVIFHRLSHTPMVFTQTTMTVNPASATVSSRPPTAIRDYDSPNGYPAVARKIILDGLNQAHPLSDSHRQTTDALLADAGANMFGIPPADVTPRRIAVAITEGHAIVSGNNPNDATIDYTLANGRLVVTNSSAKFFPIGSSSPYIYENGSFTDPENTTRLASATIFAVQTRAQQLANSPMASDQIDGLRAQLLAPSQTLITPATPEKAAAQVTGASVAPTMVVLVTTNGTAMVPSNIAFGGTRNGQPLNFRAPQISSTMTGLLTLDSLVSFATAVLLLIACILILRNNALAWRLSLIYCLVKLALNVSFGVLIYNFMASFMAAVQMPQAGPPPLAIAFIESIVMSAVISAFPLFMLFCLCLPSIRDYYNARTVSRIY